MNSVWKQRFWDAHRLALASVAGQVCFQQLKQKDKT